MGIAWDLPETAAVRPQDEVARAVDTEPLLVGRPGDPVQTREMIDLAVDVAITSDERQGLVLVDDRGVDEPKGDQP